MKTKNGVILKEIPVAPNPDYMAGEDGRIYSRTKYAGFGRKEYVDWYPLKGHKQREKQGYYHISLCHQNHKITRVVHRLICMAFHGLPPFKSAQVLHNNGNYEDNKPDNLRWGTQEENWMDIRDLVEKNENLNADVVVLKVYQGMKKKKMSPIKTVVQEFLTKPI